MCSRLAGLPVKLPVQLSRCSPSAEHGADLRMEEPGSLNDCVEQHHGLGLE